MNCDEAFERLTDSEMSDDAALEVHLSKCSRCRDMAEILEPALRFVSGHGDDFWDGSAGESYLQQTDTRPFLTQRAVSVAEEAAAALSARTTPRQRFPRPIWLAVALLAPVVLGAMILFNQESDPNYRKTKVRFSLPAVGPCTRADYAIPSDETARNPRFAHDVVMSCNSCHMMRDPRPLIDGEAYLKLTPTVSPFGFDLRQWIPDSSRESALMLTWRIASVSVSSPNC